MIKIEFNHLDEFLDELTFAQGSNQVFGPVRATTYAVRTSEVSEQHYIQAFYLSGQCNLLNDDGSPAGGYVPVVLKMFVGELFTGMPYEGMRTEIKEIQGVIQKTCENLGLELRKGRLADV